MAKAQGRARVGPRKASASGFPVASNAPPHFLRAQSAGHSLVKILGCGNGAPEKAGRGGYNGESPKRHLSVFSALPRSSPGSCSQPRSCLADLTRVRVARHGTAPLRHVAPFSCPCSLSIFWNFARGLLRQRQNWRFSLRRTVGLGNGAGAPRRAQHIVGAPRSAQPTARAEGGHEARHPKLGRVESRDWCKANRRHRASKRRARARL